MNLSAIMPVILGVLLLLVLLGGALATGIGTQTIATIGRRFSPFASTPDHKPGGVTIDWANVAANSADTTLAGSGRIVPNGTKFIEAGTILCRITSSGKFAPYAVGNSPAGVGVLLPGESFILVEDCVYSDPGSDFPPVADGGTVFYDRIIAISTNPTGATLKTPFPRIQWIDTAG